MNRRVLFVVALVLAISVWAVASVITVKFVGRNAADNRYVQLDSVAIENLTPNWRQVAVYPDTVMELSEPISTEIPAVEAAKFGIAQLAPNPAEGVAYFNLAVPQAGKILLSVTDLSGRSLLNLEEELPVGVFAYRLTMQVAEAYVVRATNGIETSVAKVINRKSAGETTLAQIAKIDSERVLMKAVKLPENKFAKTDEMQYTGYVSVGEKLYTSDKITQSQAADEELELIFHLCEPKAEEISVSACGEHVWNGITFDESGSYKQTFTTANGCDSIVTLNLTILPKVEKEISLTECVSYTWNEQTYTESGNYEQTFKAANGCDSVVTLNLTILEPAASTVNASIERGMIYNENGFNIATDTLPEGLNTITKTVKAVNGCDSVVTLNLTVIYNFHKGKESVDLGLPSGTMWATCNVGGTAPQHYGDYFMWGYPTRNNSSNCSWTDYTRFGTYKESNTSTFGFTKYNGQDGRATLESDDDAAQYYWKGLWHIPTAEQMQELVNSCTWTWTSKYPSTGVAGYTVTGPSGKSIFLPAAGYRENSEIYQQGTYGTYWTMSLGTDKCSFAYLLDSRPEFAPSSLDSFSRYYGCSIRAVYNP